LAKPYISIIAASRNDDHGTGLNKRMRLFINGLIYQCNKFKLPAELIIVDWNPPAGKPYLSEIMPRPEPGDFLALRYIVVPPEIHDSYRFSKVIPLYQMIAKNVGIRRAAADFILCTNVDLLFSDKLMEILASQTLKKDCFYRTNRCDIPAEIDEQIPFEEQLKLAEKNTMRRLGKDPQHINIHFEFKLLYKFRLLSRLVNFLLGLVKNSFMPPVDLEMINLDTLACGDFTLMHKDAWVDIQGYPEIDLYSIHIDSMALMAARALGYKQVILPVRACTYHIDHLIGWESLSAVDKIRFINERPGIGWDVVTSAGKYLLQTHGRYNFNSENWGYRNQSFAECSFNIAK
jgi:hypothetical protein